MPLHKRWFLVGIAVLLTLAACTGDADPTTSVATADPTTGSTAGSTVSSTTGPTAASPGTSPGTSTATTLAPTAETGETQVAIVPPAGTSVAFDSDGSPLDRQVRRGAGAEVAQGQTFSFPVDTVLEDITVNLEANDQPLDGAVVALEMYEFSGVDDYEPNAMLAVDGWDNPQLFQLPAGLNVSDPVYVTFDIADLTLVGGQQYGFLVRFPEGAPASETWVHHLDTDAYSDGMPFSLEGANWKGATITADLVFFLTTS